MMLSLPSYSLLSLHCLAHGRYSIERKERGGRSRITGERGMLWSVKRYFYEESRNLRSERGHRSPAPLSPARSPQVPLQNSLPTSPWTLPFTATSKIPFCDSHSWTWTTGLPSPFLPPFCSVCTSSPLPSASLPSGHNNTCNRYLKVTLFSSHTCQLSWASHTADAHLHLLVCSSGSLSPECPASPFLPTGN